MADEKMSNENEQGTHMPPTEGRYRYIAVSADMYVKLLRNECIMDKILNPLPKDTRYIRGGTDAIGNIFLVIESSEFDELKEHEEIPFHGHIMFERAFPDRAPQH